MLYNQLKNYVINDLLKLYNEYTKTNYLLIDMLIIEMVISVYFILKLTILNFNLY